MARLQIGVATCAAAPQLDEDDQLLLAAFSHSGVDPHPAVWDDPAVDWSGFDVVLVRSVWDYPLRRTSFLAWFSTCRTTANPPDVLTWNTDKRYLEDLSDAVVHTVPTKFLPPGQLLNAPDDDYVLRPTVSGSAATPGVSADKISWQLP